MGQVVIRDLDEALLADYRVAAAYNDRPLEAELREVLQHRRPVQAVRRENALRWLDAIRRMTPDLPQTLSEKLVREDRAGYRDA